MKVAPYLTRLGITQEHIESCKLPLEQEADTLASAGLDIYDREVLMTEDTLEAWISMKSSAEKDGIELQLVSGFRSVEYQCNLFEKKLSRGIKIDDILTVNAIPGYSEHHTGKALDLSTPGYTPLETEFENSTAFEWLVKNGTRFGFSMSYPRGNLAGIDYEPWHWAFKG